MSQPRDPGDTRWSSIALEIGIVVAGILIAFALDSWWDSRAAANRERAHLRALRADFAENVERLHGHVEVEKAIAASALHLLRLQRSAKAAPPDSVVDHLRQVFTSGRYDPTMGAYQTLVSSGDLSLIRDDGLRRSLVNYASALETRYYERVADELYLDFVREYTGRLRWLDWPGREWGAEVHGIPPSPTPWDPAPLLQDPKFSDHLALRHLTARDVAENYRALGEAAREILARIDARLAP